MNQAYLKHEWIVTGGGGGYWKSVKPKRIKGVGVLVKNKAGRVLGTIRVDGKAFTSLDQAMRATFKRRPISQSSLYKGAIPGTAYTVTIGGK